jgi:hypothetical protein
MPKLNQIVAVVAGKKADAEKALTALYHKVQKPQLFDGLAKTYETLEADGEELPAETKLIQFKAAEAIAQFREIVSPVLDATLTQDVANTQTTADVEVDGKVILAAMPVTYLLFLEKKLADLHTFISHLPTLDPGQTWQYSRDSDCYVTPMTWKYHTKKLPRVLEKAPATDKHPAQVEVVHEDKNVGKWKTINQSGAMPARDQHDMLARVKKLVEAVKKAREAANMVEVENKHASGSLFEYVFGVSP